MIVVEGLPGSGKSFYIVNWIIKRHYDYDKDYFEFAPKSENPVRIYTNVAGLKLKMFMILLRPSLIVRSVNILFTVTK